ncbi:MAG: hypothetical protein O7A71_00045 [Chloroflexi bacterium]|nr:hypothetical protein [Chloroflexota bacterium]
MATATAAEGVTDGDPSWYSAAAAPGDDTPLADVAVAIDIELFTNGVDADLPAQAVGIPSGNAVNWSYRVTNEGPEALTDITVVDDNGTPDDPSDDITIVTGVFLDSGATVVFTAQGTAVVGLFGNIAVVVSAEGATDFDPSHYIASLTPVPPPTQLPNGGTGGLARTASDGWIAYLWATVAGLGALGLLTWYGRRRFN